MLKKTVSFFLDAGPGDNRTFVFLVVILFSLIKMVP